MAFDCRVAFITGGGSGIGRGLAEALARRGARVIVSGRRQEALEAVAAAHDGIESVVLDVTRPQEVRTVAADVQRRFGPVDCVINNAGVQRAFDLTHPQALAPDYFHLEIATNLSAAIDVATVWLPHLQSQSHGTLINVTSGLSFAPLPRVPVYCATKAALRSFTLSLRQQRTGLPPHIVELIPPAVVTELHDYMGPSGRSIGIPLASFVQEALEGLDRGDDEIFVGDCRNFAGSSTQVHAAIERMHPRTR
jgi:uncharacterized oxidoreductase